jgi:hypothetical protein
MKTPITPEALIELGFKKIDKVEFLFSIQETDIDISICSLKYIYIESCNSSLKTNATTMEDIKDLIRLFK